MRIGCLQFAPRVGDVNNNLSRADAVLSKSSPEGLDLLVLPELAFSGEWNFIVSGASALRLSCHTSEVRAERY